MCRSEWLKIRLFVLVWCLLLILSSRMVSLYAACDILASRLGETRTGECFYRGGPHRAKGGEGRKRGRRVVA